MDYGTILTIGFAAFGGMFGAYLFPIWQLGLGVGIVTGAALGVVLMKQSGRIRELEEQLDELEGTRRK